MTQPSPDLAVLAAAMPFAVATGVELVSAAPGAVEARLPWAPERCTVGDLLHGGALMTLADSAGAVCAFLNLPPGAGTATIESKTNLFRGVRSGTVTARSRPLHVGRTTITVATDCYDGDDRHVAHTVQTQAVLQG